MTRGSSSDALSPADRFRLQSQHRAYAAALRKEFLEVKVFRDGNSLFQCCRLAELVLSSASELAVGGHVSAESAAAVLRRGLREAGREAAAAATAGLRQVVAERVGTLKAARAAALDEAEREVTDRAAQQASVALQQRAEELLEALGADTRQQAAELLRTPAGARQALRLRCARMRTLGEPAGEAEVIAVADVLQRPLRLMGAEGGGIGPHGARPARVYGERGDGQTATPIVLYLLPDKIKEEGIASGSGSGASNGGGCCAQYALLIDRALGRRASGFSSAGSGSAAEVLMQVERLRMADEQIANSPLPQYAATSPYQSDKSPAGSCALRTSNAPSARPLRDTAPVPLSSSLVGDLLNETGERLISPGGRAAQRRRRRPRHELMREASAATEAPPSPRNVPPETPPPRQRPEESGQPEPSASETMDDIWARIHGGDAEASPGASGGGRRQSRARPPPPTQGLEQDRGRGDGGSETMDDVWARIHGGNAEASPGTTDQPASPSPAAQQRHLEGHGGGGGGETMEDVWARIHGGATELHQPPPPSQQAPQPETMEEVWARIAAQKGGSADEHRREPRGAASMRASRRARSPRARAAAAVPPMRHPPRARSPPAMRDVPQQPAPSPSARPASPSAEKARAMHACARVGLLGDVERMIVDDGADPRARSDEGRTLLHVAAMHNSKSLARLAMRVTDYAPGVPRPPPAEALVNARDSTPQGSTALHLCVQYGHVELATWLIEHGADEHLPDAGGVTAAQLRERKVASAPVSPADSATASRVDMLYTQYTEEELRSCTLGEAIGMMVASELSESDYSQAGVESDWGSEAEDDDDRHEYARQRRFEEAVPGGADWHARRDGPSGGWSSGRYSGGEGSAYSYSGDSGSEYSDSLYSGYTSTSGSSALWSDDSDASTLASTLSGASSLYSSGGSGWGSSAQSTPRSSVCGDTPRDWRRTDISQDLSEDEVDGVLREWREARQRQRQHAQAGAGSVYD